MRNLRHFGSMRLAAAMLLSTLCIPASGLSQDTHSQRRLSTGQGSLSPVDQIRLLLQLQQLNETRAPSEKRQQNTVDLENELLRKLVDKWNPIKSGPQRSQPPAVKQQPPNQPETLTDLQRLKNDLGQPAQDAIRPGRPSPTQDRRRPGQHKQLRPHDRLGTGSPRPQSSADRTLTADARNDMWDSFKKLRARDFSGMSSTQRAAARQQQRSQREPPINNSNRSFDIKRELSERGLETTFRRLVRNIRKKVQQETRKETGKPQISPETSAWDQAVVNVLDAVRDDVVDMVRTSKAHKTDHSSENRNTAKIVQDSGMRSAQQSVIDGPATELSVANDSSPSAGRREDSTSATFGNVPEQRWSLAGSNTTQLLVILLGLIIAAVAFRSAARYKTLAQTAQRSRLLTAVKPQNIRTRADVIRAFHWLTHCQSPDTANWWNHLQAEASLLQQTPGRRQSLQQLTRLYEIARYQPDDQAFDQTFIRQARNALAGCLS